jgi:nitroreductase
MELTDALRTTGSVRAFLDEPVPDEVIYAILDDARFAPSGGNRQAWRVIIVKDAQRRQALRDLYLDGWHDYIAHVLAGLIPFSPLASDEDRAAAAAKRSAAIEVSKPDGFPETLDQVPAMLVICADLASLAATDRDLGRYQIAGGDLSVRVEHSPGGSISRTGGRDDDDRHAKRVGCARGPRHTAGSDRRLDRGARSSGESSNQVEASCRRRVHDDRHL